jgi:hypothetical protein
VARHEREGRRRDRISSIGHCLSEPDRRGGREPRALAGARPALSARLPPPVGREGQRTGAGREHRVARRPLHAVRRPRRAAESGAGHRQCRPRARRQDLSAMRGARARDIRRQGLGRRHREGHYCLRQRRAGRRRLVAALLRQPRHLSAAALGGQFGAAHGAACRRARSGCCGGAIRLPQAPGRRIFDQPPSSVGCRRRAGLVCALLHLSAGAQARQAGIETAAWAPLHRGSEAGAALGARPNVALRAGAGSRSRARRRNSRGGARQPQAHLSGLRRSRGGRALGRLHRCHARCRAGDLRRRQPCRA